MKIQVHPHTFIFSLYGRYVLPRGDEIWVGSLIQALDTLDFSAGAVRALVSRMQRKCLLQSRRQGRRSFYRLTDLGLKEVGWGKGRAYTTPGDTWDGRWTVMAYSMPEKRRQHRDALRRSLEQLGFGPLAPGTWISPHPLPLEAEQKWRALGVWDYLEIFRAEHLAPSEPHTLVSQAWPQLPVLASYYQEYIATCEPLLRHFQEGQLDGSVCFATQLRSLIEFVALTLGDPSLPPALLPSDWPRPRAQTLFKTLQQELSGPAEGFFDAIYEPRNDR